MYRSLHFNRAVSVPDFLLGLATISLLMFLLIPALLRAHETARRNLCTNNLKQIGTALQKYYSVYDHFPPGGTRKNELSWHVLLLPMLGHDTLYDMFDLRKGSYHSTSVNHRNNPYGLTRISEYLCPTAVSDRSGSDTDAINECRTYTVHYYGIMGPRGENSTGTNYCISAAGPFGEQGLFGFESKKRLADVTDGASRTFIIGELSWNNANCYRTWVRGCNADTIAGAKNVQWPINTDFYGKEFTRRYEHYVSDGNASGFNDVSLGSEHPRGTQVLMGDCGVRFVAETVDLFIYRGAASIDGGERETLDD